MVRQHCILTVWWGGGATCGEMKQQRVAHLDETYRIDEQGEGLLRDWY